MKCEFVIDVEADVDQLNAEQKKALLFKPVKARMTGKIRQEAYFPMGAVIEHPHAAQFVNMGMAIPADDECEAAADPISPEERTRRQKNYQAVLLGIVPEDRELFMADVIAGYEMVAGRQVYKAGPNYQQWRDSQAKLQPTPETDIV